MAEKLDRAIFVVAPCDDGWAVESDGLVLDRLNDKEEAKAAANKRARAAQDAGKPCMVRINGESGFFAHTR